MWCKTDLWGSFLLVLPSLMAVKGTPSSVFMLMTFKATRCPLILEDREVVIHRDGSSRDLYQEWFNKRHFPSKYIPFCEYIYISKTFFLFMKVMCSLQKCQEHREAQSDSPTKTTSGSWCALILFDPYPHILVMQMTYCKYFPIVFLLVHLNSYCILPTEKLGHSLNIYMHINRICIYIYIYNKKKRRETEAGRKIPSAGSLIKTYNGWD